MLRLNIGFLLAFYQIRDENRAKFKISYSCGHRVSKSARSDASINNTEHADTHTASYTEAAEKVILQDIKSIKPNLLVQSFMFKLTTHLFLRTGQRRI